jgi:hypothetical protein
VTVRILVAAIKTQTTWKPKTDDKTFDPGCDGFLACVLPAWAQTVAVTVDGNTYNVSAGSATLNSSGSLLGSQGWGNTLAQAFTTAVGLSLGIGSRAGDQAGPLFLYAADRSGLFSYASVNNTTTPLDFSGGMVIPG